MSTEPSKAEAEEARLTAYALGELDADEIREIESLLAESGEVRDSLAEIRETATLLETEFSNAPVLRLRQEQVEAIAGNAMAEPVAEDNVVSGGFRRWGSGLAVAACAFLFAAVGMKEYVTEITTPKDQSEISRSKKSKPAGSLAEPVGAKKSEVEGDDEAGRKLAGASSPVRENAEKGGNFENTKKKEALHEKFEEADSAGGVPMAVDPSEVRRAPGKAATEEDSEGIGQRQRGPEEPSVAALNKRQKDKDDGQNGRGFGNPKTRMATIESDTDQIVDRLKSLSTTGPSPKDSAKVFAAKEAIESRNSDSDRPDSRKPDNSPMRSQPREPLDPLHQPESERPSAPRRTIHRSSVDNAEDVKGKEKRDKAEFGPLVDNEWVDASKTPRSAFRVGGGEGSYERVRGSLLREEKLPQRDAVKIEEIVNHFKGSSTGPGDEGLVSAMAVVADCPWTAGERLVMIRLEGRDSSADELAERIPVNISVTFDASKVREFRLVGYANPEHSEFAQATALGAGHLERGETVTAFYQVRPMETATGAELADESPNSDTPAAEVQARQDSPVANVGAMLVVGVSFRDPESDSPDQWQNLNLAVPDGDQSWTDAGEGFRLAAATAGFGMLLRESEHTGALDYDMVLEIAGEGVRGRGAMAERRNEFLSLVKKAKKLSRMKDGEKEDVLKPE